VFPLLLALGLGLAFRNKPVNTTRLAIVSGEDAQRVLSLLQSSAQSTVIRADVVDLATAKNGLRLGKYDLIVESPHDGHLQFDYDPARPESVLSRSEVGQAWQTSPGRKDVLIPPNPASRDPGSPPVEFLI